MGVKLTKLLKDTLECEEPLKYNRKTEISNQDSYR